MCVCMCVCVCVCVCVYVCVSVCVCVLCLYVLGKKAALAAFPSPPPPHLVWVAGATLISSEEVVLSEFVHLSV